MKKIIGALIALYSAFAFSATTVPVQLLNPTGSSSGQAIVSTGASSAPAWGGIGLNGIAAIAANTVIGNATGSSAAPTAITVTGCNGAAQALQWTNGSGFGCNSAIATSGANTNITSLSSPTITTPNITGVTNASSAAAGSVGEYAAGSATSVSLTSGVSANCTSVSLTAGDWDVAGNITYTAAGSTIIQQLQTGFNSTSATLPSPTYLVNAIAGVTFAGGSVYSQAPPTQRVNVSSTTTINLVTNAVFTTSTLSANCFIWARRRR